MPLLPSDIRYGTVIGQWLLAVADTAADPDRRPDAVYPDGTVTFTPTFSRVTNTADPIVSVTAKAITSRLVLGALHDGTGPGVTLITGTYDVTFAIGGITVAPLTLYVPPDATVDVNGALPTVPPVTGGTVAVDLSKYVRSVNNTGPDSSGNVTVATGGSGGGTTIPSGGWLESQLEANVRAALAKARTGVQSVNGVQPDADGNVTIATGGGSGGGLDDAGVAALLGSDGSQTGRALVREVREITGVGGVPPSIAKTLNIGPGDGQNHMLLQVAPVGAASYQTVTQDELVAGYSLDPNFMRVIETDGISRVQMWTRMDGATTPGSQYSRTELREVMPDGTTLVGFDANTGTHWLRGRTRITHLSAVKPETVIAQLHNGAADRIAIRTQVISGVTKLVVRLNGAAQTPRLEEAYVLGDEFEWMIRLDNGVCRVFYDDMLVPVFTFPAGSLAPTAGVNTWYFKAGNYSQSNVSLGESPTDYDLVQLRSLQHWHTGWPDPDPIGSYRVTADYSGGGSTPAPSGTEYVQASAASTWTIPHTLGRRPTVAVYVGGEEVEADVTATASSVTITHAAPYAGTAVLT